MRTDGRLVLDIGCNAGMMLGAALGDGAAFGASGGIGAWSCHTHGSSSPAWATVIDLYRRWSPGPGTRCSTTCPSGSPRCWTARSCCISRCTTTSDSHGRSAASTWSVIVFEGAETDRVDTLDQTLAPLRELCDFEVAWAQDFRDSETDARPVAILRRLLRGRPARTPKPGRRRRLSGSSPPAAGSLGAVRWSSPGASSPAPG